MKKERFLLAVSGGVDSMMMLHRCLHGYMFRALAVAHCNFQLRGEESDGDEEMVREVCAEYGVHCYVKKFDTEQFAKEQKYSIQEAARDLRYKWFEELMDQEGFSCVITAHHFDDNVETVLMNLMRGTGINGLCGIPNAQGRIRRIHLDMSKEEILEYAKEHELRWREDSSNESEKYLRNRVRHELIPLMGSMHSSFPKSMIGTIKYLNAVRDILRSHVCDFKEQYCRVLPDGMSIDMEALYSEDHPEIIVHELTGEYGFKFGQIYDLLRSGSGPGTKILAGDWILTVDRTTLELRNLKASESNSFIIEQGSVSGEHPFRWSIKRLAVSEVSYTDNPWQSHMDASKLKFPLEIRPWKTADKMRPLGMSGQKKISDILVDSKVPLVDKPKVHVIEDSSGEIIWCIGHRLSEKIKISDTTMEVLKWKFEN